jgi:acetyl esterase
MIPIDIALYREEARALNAKLPRIFPEIPLGSYDARATIDTEWGPTEVDVYRPFGTRGQKLPVFFNIHGGGYCIGFREPDDPYCRLIAEWARCVVVNVGYVIAPEHAFPAPVEQCYSLLRWFHDRSNEFIVDSDRIAIGGHSAGGGIAAAVSLLQRQRGEFPMTTQILDYPYIDLATPPGEKDWGNADPEYRDELVNVFDNYVAWYLQDPGERAHLLASPAGASLNQVEGVCPALIIVAGRDSLAGEADRYARLLMETGVEVSYRKFPDSIHGFTHILPEGPARDAWKLIATHLGEMFMRER